MIQTKVETTTEFGLFINGKWHKANGPQLQSNNPGNGENIWEGNCANPSDINRAVSAARSSFELWSNKSLSEREKILISFSDLLDKHSETLAEAISRETGKPLWESRTEASAMKGKIELSIRSYHERTGTTVNNIPIGKSVISYKPHGVIAVFGPYNFPGHLPNGHIVPALLAGNTIVFKPSEYTPAVAQLTVKLWQKAGIPNGVLNLVQGEKETGITLASHPDLDGIFFTGSSTTGKTIHQQYGGQPAKILALEMGGNNPLIVCEVSNVRAAIHDTIQSSFITTGQRCTCARRLFVPVGSWGDNFLSLLEEATKKIKVGLWDDDEQPFMGSLISEAAANNIIDIQKSLKDLGATEIVQLKKLKNGTGLISPGIIDVTPLLNLPDEEYFGPLLQVIRYQDFDAAITAANNTRFGLSAGLLSENPQQYQIFAQRIKSGIVNWNRPTTGASSASPFGGHGDSGNHRPSAYFAADYCSFPVASIESETLKIPENLAPGLEI